MLDELKIIEEVVENTEHTGEELDKDDREVMEAFYRLTDARVREIVSARECLIQTKTIKDGEVEAEKMKKEVDKFIADKSAEYQKKYKGMEVPDILADMLMFSLLEHAEVKMRNAIEKHNSDN